MSAQVRLESPRFAEVKLGDELRHREQTSNLASFLMGVAWWGSHRIHYDHKWARHDGFDDVVVMGSHMYAWVDRMLTRWSGDPSCLRRLGFRHVSVANVEDVLEIVARVTGTREAGDAGEIDWSIEIAKSDGTLVATGTAVVRLPL
jgi:3-methylfumaryl-CoA hydratase